MSSHITLLDATLRDGGQGLEDLYNNRFSEKCFAPDVKQFIRQHLEDAHVDIIELGAIAPSNEDKSRFAIYRSLEELSTMLPKQRAAGCMYAGLYIGPDTDIDNIPDWAPELVEGVRVILRYSALERSLQYCRALAQKGYKVFVQPMLTLRYSDEELDRVISYANDMGAYACYFVDSYGYMESDDIKRLFDYYNNRLDQGIRIGFHAHNNMGMAYANALSFLKRETDRELILDSCVMGMGQGAGNLQTEQIIPYLNAHSGKQYDLEPVLDICDQLESDMLPMGLWGYSVVRLLPAIHHAAYKYATVMRSKYKMSLREIHRVLADMPEPLRHRYTATDLESILKDRTTHVS